MRELEDPALSPLDEGMGIVNAVRVLQRAFVDVGLEPPETIILRDERQIRHLDLLMWKLGFSSTAEPPECVVTRPIDGSLTILGLRILAAPQNAAA